MKRNVYPVILSAAKNLASFPGEMLHFVQHDRLEIIYRPLCILVLSMFFLLACVSCERTQAPPPPTPAQTHSDAADTSSDELATLKDLEFVLFDAKPTVDNVATPSFRVSAGKCTLGEANTWLLENAHAVIYNAKYGETELTAGRGRFDQTAKSAYLESGVTLHDQTMTVELEDVTWLNDEGIARSEKPLVVTDGETRLTADGMEFYAKERRLILKNVSGQWRPQWDSAS